MNKRPVSSFRNQHSQISNIDPIKRINKNFKKISSFSERQLFNFYLSDIAKKFNYQIPSVSKENMLRTIKRPFKYERLYDCIFRRTRTVKIIKELENKPLYILWLNRWKKGEAVQD